MYRIIGADQKTYGPVSADTIREWIASRRANASTQVQAETEGRGGDWKALSEFPEFKEALAGAGGPPPIHHAPASTAAPTAPPKTSGMAITSLVCGVLGCFGITAVIGVILGIVSLVRINRSQGRLGGQGIAIAGLAVSAAMIVFILPGMLLPALAKAKGRAQTINCVNNLKELALGARIYANDSGGKFPNASNWCDAIRSHIGSQRVFHCPAERNTLCSYGYNASLSGKSEGEVHPSTVMFFEIPGGWNVSGGPEQLIQKSRHRAFVNVAFADGSVQQMRQDQLSDLRWEP